MVRGSSTPAAAGSGPSPTPIEVRTRDPLEGLTRKERRNLLAVSTAAIAVTQMRLIPTKVAALGIEFESINQSAFLKILAGVLVYFLVAFLIYSVSDWLSGRWSLQQALQAQSDEIAARVR